MCEKQNNVPVTDSESTGRVSQNLPIEETELKEYYAALFQRTDPHVPADYPTERCLKLLRKRTKRRIDMFNHPLSMELLGIHKACMCHVVTEDVSQKDKLQVFNSWELWFDILTAVTRRNSFIMQNLQNQCRQLNDLKLLRASI